MGGEPASADSRASVWTLDLPDTAAAVQRSTSDHVLGVATLAGPVLFVDEARGEILREVPGHAGGALAIAFGSSLVATGGQDGEIHLCPQPWGTPAARISAGSAPVSHLAWSPDGEVLAAATGRAVRFWSRGGELLGEHPDHPSTVLSLCFSPEHDGWLSTAYGGVHLISRKTLRPNPQLFARTSLLVAAPSPCGRYVAAGAQEPVVRVWDREGGDDPVHLEGYRGKVAALAWSAKGPLLATASGSAVVLWSFAGGDPYQAPHVELSGHAGRVFSLAFVRDGYALWTACADGRLRLFDLTKGAAPARTLEVGAPVHLVMPGLTEATVLAASTDGRLSSWSVDP